MIVFDVDGVLVDTANLVSLSYRLAGSSPPMDILAQEHSDWLVRQVGASSASRIKRKKDDIYLRGLLEVGFLPPLLVAQELHRRGTPTAAVTAAPQGTIALLKRRINPWPFTTSTDGMRTPAKMRFLPVLAPTGVYIDDQDQLIDMPTGWRFVHYTSQTKDQLYEEIIS